VFACVSPSAWATKRRAEKHPQYFGFSSFFKIFLVLCLSLFCFPVELVHKFSLSVWKGIDVLRICVVLLFLFFTAGVGVFENISGLLF